MKKYRLLQSIRDPRGIIEAGETFTKYADTLDAAYVYKNYTLHPSHVEHNPEWFEEIHEPPSNKQEPSKEVFEWTDELVNEYVYAWMEEGRPIQSYKQHKQSLNTDSKERPDGLAIDAGKGTADEWETLINLWHKFKPSILFGSKKYTQEQLDKEREDAFEAGRGKEGDKTKVADNVFVSTSIHQYPTFQDYLTHLSKIKK